MQDEGKTREQLVQELETLRCRVIELEAAEAEYQRARAALEEARERYNILFEYSGESIFVIDPSTLRFLAVNANAARRLGYSQKELLQLTLNDVESPDSDNTYASSVWESTISGTTFYECDYLCKDGDAVPVEVSSRHVHFGNREILLHFVRDISRRRRVEADREQLVYELQDALAHVKTLSGLLPICAKCKKIRDDQGYWHSVEIYVRDHSEARFSHGMCPDCMKELYPWHPSNQEQEGSTRSS